jgi:hypothetical protein
MELALSNIGLMPESKKQIEMFAEMAINEINQGIYNPLDVEIKLKAVEKTIEKIREGIKDYVIEESKKHGKKFTIAGHNCEIRSTGRYDFSECNDSYLVTLKNQVKQREEWLKSLSDATADPETGEIIYPAVKKTSESLVVTFRNE